MQDCPEAHFIIQLPIQNKTSIKRSASLFSGFITKTKAAMDTEELHWNSETGGWQQTIKSFKGLCMKNALFARFGSANTVHTKGKLEKSPQTF